MGGCASAPPAGGQVEITLKVPNMPLEGGPAEVKTPDDVTLQFFAPAGYGKDTQIRTSYIPAPKPKATPKPKAAAAAQKPAAKAKAKAEPAKPPAQSDTGGQTADTGGQTGNVVSNEVQGEPQAQLETDPPSSMPLVPAKPQQVTAKIVYPLDKGMPRLPAQLPKMEGTWDWIRQANDELHRVTRKDAGELLREAFKKGGYCMQQGSGPSQLVRFACIPKMVAGTQIISYGQGFPKLGKDPQFKMELEYGQGITPIEKAQTMALKGGLKPASVNAASAFHAGGGFTTGGRHALEEAFCSQSTLYVSLEKAMDLWTAGEKRGIYRNDSPGYHQHIPTDGCIVSPNVEIFRGNTDQGYLAHTRTVPVTAIISVAMYNKNSRVRDAPVDAPSDPKLYEEGVRKKFTSMIHGAALSGANAIIIPDVGCGVFQNDPAVCGKIVGEVLFNYQSYFKRAVFTGKDAFYNAAVEAIKNASKSGAMPITADVAKRSCIVPLDAQAHLYCRSCAKCKRGLAGSDFSSLALLVDKTHKSHQMQFIHEDCINAAYKDFPQHQPMRLPDITKNAQSFLKALDLSGDGFVEKQELKCIAALFWDGDLSKDSAAFEKDFEARFQSWDADDSGNVDLAQIKARPSAQKANPSVEAEQKQQQNKNSLCLDAVPKSCIQWFQDEAQKRKN